MKRLYEKLYPGFPRLKNMLKYLCLISASLPITAFAQQSGNYESDYIEVRTRSKDASGNPQYSEWKPFETRLINKLEDFKPLINVSLNKYGSDLSKKYKATGFFRTEKLAKRWWIIDPDGYAGINVSVNSINQGTSQRNQKAFEEKFTNTLNWMSKTKQEISALGFNGAGSWSQYDDIIQSNQKENPLAYCINLNLMADYGKKRGGTFSVPGHTGYPGGTIFAFDSEFEKFCEEQLKKLIKYTNDPNLFGYFSDNEMPLNVKNLTGYLSITNKQDPGYLAAKKWLNDRGISETEITPKHETEFLAFVGERYFSVVNKAIKKYDPNHLFLGSRFYSSEKNIPEFMKAVGPYIDIISINYYGAWTPNIKYMENWGNWAKKPFLITEFYTKGMDSGLPNISGAGWLVKTQEDRGKAYQNYCLGLLESKNCVGWHWFKYQDNDPNQTKAEASNTDANKGLVDNNYNIYYQLADLMKQLNINRYQIINYFDQLNKK